MLKTFFSFRFNSFMVKLDQQHAKELVLLNKWKLKAKSIDSTLVSLEGKLKVLQSEQISESNAETLLTEIQVYFLSLALALQASH